MLRNVFLPRMSSNITSGGLNVFFAANSLAGRRSLDASLTNNAREDLARSLQNNPATNNPVTQARNLAVKAQSGTALTTQFDYATADDGSTYITGVTIGAERRVAKALPEGTADNAPLKAYAPAPQPAARPRSFADIAAPKTMLTPADELALYAQSGLNEGGASALIQRANPSREALIVKQYQSQSDLVYTANPLFDAAA